MQVRALNTSDNNLFDNDPDDILDIVIQPRSISPQPVRAAEFEPPTLETTSAIVLAPESPEEQDGWHVASTTDGIVGTRATSDFPTTTETDEIAENEPHWFGLMVREVVETVGLAVIIFLIIRIGIQNYRIEGASMEPNFHDGEYLIVNKLAYRLGEYERGDVIVFKYPNDPSKDYIKRVIGLPGDTVEIRGGQLYVNNVEIVEPYLHMPNTRDEPPTVVDAGHLYVMGDNRPASSDTRSWGQLGQEFVIGQAWLAIWPFDTAGLVKHQPIEVSAVMAQGP
ncbi:MAG: signal peptidase I [Chloroflexi bacterium]|nr:MAG: signal peptidase I [Chloroflexota bacterium]